MGLKRVTTTATDFQELEIWKAEASCEFRVAGAVHAWWHRDRFLTGLAWDNLAAAALLRPGGPPRSILMLGLAGGTTLHTLRLLLPEVEITAVDIDPEIIELARRHMHLDDTNAEVHIADAYEWAAASRKQYDVVIDDCYLAGETDVFRPERHPERLVETLSPRVAPGGLLLANLVTGSGHRRLQSRMRAAFRRAFPEVRSVSTPDSMNETLVAGDRVLTAAALNEWTKRFLEKKDRNFWERIRVSKLG